MSRFRLALLAGAAVLVVLAVAIAVVGSERRVPAVRFEYALQDEAGNTVDARDHALAVIRHRIDRATRGKKLDVSVHADHRIIVELADAPPDLVADIRQLLAQRARLEIARIDPDADFFNLLHAQTTVVAPRGIDAVSEPWPTTDVPTRPRLDRFLTASGRTTLERYLAMAAIEDKNHAIPGDRRITYEQLEAKGTTTWRTHVIEHQPWLTGTAIREAKVTIGDHDQRPQVLLELEPRAADRFGELTAKHVGDKLAIILDDEVKSAPVIRDAIRGGQVVITLGTGTTEDLQQQATDLAAVLGAGEMPGTLELLATKNYDFPVEGIRWNLLAPLGLAAVLLAILAMGRR